MKQSGIDWIGEIPDDWNVNKIDSLYILRNTKVSDKDYPPLSVTMQGIVPQLATAAKSDDGDNRKLVKKGDFAINSRSDRRGSSGVSAYDGSVSLINTILTPRGEMNPIYYNWLFHTIQFEDEFYKWGHGIVDDLWTTRWQDMKNIFIVVPPKAIQQRIAEYLDSKCAQIDSIIEESKKSIEEYKAWKQSVIFEAVTGKNLTCKKKASGIEWIGEIPEGWTCTKLKYYIQIKSGDAIRNEELTDIGLYQVFGGGECIGMTNRYNADSSNILIGRVGARCGCITKPNDKVWATDNALIVSTNMNRDFLTYCLQAVNLNELNNSNAQPLITGTKVKNTFIPIPDNLEQKKIVTYLDSRCAQIDSLIAEKESLIADLTEYKKSLIFEVVTGKRSV